MQNLYKCKKVISGEVGGAKATLLVDNIAPNSRGSSNTSYTVALPNGWDDYTYLLIRFWAWDSFFGASEFYHIIEVNTLKIMSDYSIQMGSRYSRQGITLSNNSLTFSIVRNSDNSSYGTSDYWHPTTIYGINISDILPLPV